VQPLNFTQYFIVFCLALLHFNNANCQDNHYSQFYYAPLSINPAHTGSFTAKNRVVINYRQQWSFLPFPYITSSFSFDKRLATKKLKTNILAIGLSAISDKGGVGNLSTQGAAVSLAYHQSVSETGSTIGLGFQYGLYQLGFDKSVLKFGDQVISGTTTSLENFATTQLVYSDLNTGILVNVKTKGRYGYLIGFSYNHILQPTLTFYSPIKINKYTPRYTAQYGMAIAVTPKVQVNPMSILQHQGASTEWVLGSSINYFIKKGFVLKSGLWFRQTRNSDAIIVNVGTEWKGVIYGLSYDVNVSSLRKASNGRGALEMAIQYKFGKIKYLSTYKVKGKLMNCPMFD
jgi:type IX secretion system PorP/SprF family membrane protein